MTSPSGNLFGAYQSQTTRQLAQISSSKYPDTNKDFEANIRRLNNFVDYLAQYVGTMQKGVDQANADPITRMRDMVADFTILLGGGELLYGINLGDLQYFLPALGAIFGLDANVPFPINLFNMAEKFFLGYVVPLDAFGATIEDIILGWATALGLNSEFVTSLREVLDEMVALGTSLMQILTDLFNLLDILGISTDGFGIFGDIWHAITQLLGAFGLNDLGTLTDPVFHALAPWVHELAQILHIVSGFVDVIGGDLSTGNLGVFDPIWSVVSTIFDSLSAPEIAALDMVVAAMKSWTAPFVTMLAAVVDAFSGVISPSLVEPMIAILSPVADMFAGMDLVALEPIMGMFTTWTTPFVDALVTVINTLEPILGLITSLVGGGGSGGIIDLIGIGQITDLVQNLLPNANFLGGSSAITDGGGVWSVVTDIVHGVAGGASPRGSATAGANGTLRELFSDPATQVVPGQTLDVSSWLRWTGVTSTSGQPAFKLGVTYYDALWNILSTTTLQQIVNPASASVNVPEGGFILLSGADTVPALAKYARTRLTITQHALTGVTWWGDGSFGKTQPLKASWLDDWQNLLDSLWEGIFGSTPIGGVGFLDIIDGLQHFPPSNVNGVLGGTIADTLQDQIDAMYSGFARLFGGVSGKSILDVASQASGTVTTATTALELAEWNNAVAMVRNNKSLMEGMDETTESNFLLSDLFSAGADPAGIISATSASYPVAYWRAKEFAHKGVITWFGKGFASITNLFIDIYKLNFTTNQSVLLHSSTDQIGQVTASWGLCRYTLPTGSRFDVTNGDVIGVSWRVVGAGTHSIAGKVAGSWLPADTAVTPQKPASTRTGTGNVAFASIVYSNNVPWFGIGIASGDMPVDYHAPRTTQLTVPGAFTYDVPDWATHVDEILVGAAGGGKGGDFVAFQTGHGGFAGAFATRTLVRGTDFGSGAGIQFTGSIGSGGAAGGWPSGNGSAGSATTRAAISGGAGAASAAGGAGGTDFGTPKTGGSPGVQTYNGTDYPGGSGGSSVGGNNGGPGEAPGGGGGGGSGGTWGVAWAGGPGARGGAWYVARQVL